MGFESERKFTDSFNSNRSIETNNDLETKVVPDNKKVKVRIPRKNSSNRKSKRDTKQTKPNSPHKSKIEKVNSFSTSSSSSSDEDSENVSPKNRKVKKQRDSFEIERKFTDSFNSNRSLETKVVSDNEKVKVRIPR